MTYDEAKELADNEPKDNVPLNQTIFDITEIPYVMKHFKQFIKDKTFKYDEGQYQNFWMLKLVYYDFVDEN